MDSDRKAERVYSEYTHKKEKQEYRDRMIEHFEHLKTQISGAIDTMKENGENPDRWLRSERNMINHTIFIINQYYEDTE